MYENRLLTNLKRHNRIDSLLSFVKTLKPFLHRKASIGGNLQRLEVELIVLRKIIHFGKITQCDFINGHSCYQEIFSKKERSEKKLVLLRALFRLVSWVSVCRHPNRRGIMRECMECLGMIKTLI